jgi:hypothetical protein
MRALKYAADGLIAGIGLFALVSLFGGIQNSVLFDRALPADVNAWGVLILPTIAGLYGLYLGLIGELRP